jgi:hypothetical protein
MTKVIHKKLGRENARGMTNGYRNSTIQVDPRLRPKTYLGTIIHEQLHISCPDWSESRVLRVEKELRNVLWDHNFRQTKQ